PPPSTLFAYTTLFRSELLRGFEVFGVEMRRGDLILTIRAHELRKIGGSVFGIHRIRAVAVRKNLVLRLKPFLEVGFGCITLLPIDRKSTRLNSSHRTI